jgi:hypothetical protein
MAHENLERQQHVEGSSDRGFGLVFATVFAIIAAWPLMNAQAPRWWALGLAALLALAAAAPAPALAQKTADVSRIEAAVVELAKQKRDAQAQANARASAAQAALGACRSKGRGWNRIRAVRDASQRNAYARGAKALWGDLREVAAEGAWVEVYTPHFERFLRRFESPLADPVLQAGVDAQAKRLAFNQAAYSFGNCGTFNRLLKKVREFKIGGSHGVAGDYYAGRIHNILVGYVSSQERSAARAHWGSRYDAALDAARNQLKALGGDEGYANYFAFAFKG